MIDQTGQFAESESYRLLRGQEGFDRPTIIEQSIGMLLDQPVQSILDAGCGTAVNLQWLVDRLDATSGLGVEPSEASVQRLTASRRTDARLSFQVASAHNLPFATNSFDLVVCWSVLHWVGRNEYLQSLGELIRVTRRFLLIMDFVAAEEYRVSYSHHQGLFTYKQDFETAVLSSGIMLTRESVRFWEPEPGRPIFLQEQDLEPFLGNPHSYHARKACVFEKDYEVLPLHDAADFS